MLFTLFHGISSKHVVIKKLSDAISKTQHPDRKIKIFPGLVTYVGETHEKHYQKAELDQKLSIEDALKQLSFLFNKIVQIGN